ncbi:peptidase M10A and M12B matrixin and adamalysin [Halosolutus halophilus]|uniref:peptidase M10A and M12B matrixin and adamalysin n=1 Tax=Halosolutus halophilus TaxID=1552990 RepID=UPI0022350090|nr:peptidase M10A and M12B matrixin and adamalysin [Halosolutus halophilus]
MNRRVFLGALGSIASLGTIGYATRDPVERLEVRVWFTERADEYDAVATRVSGYLGRILDLNHWSLDLSIGGVVPVSTEDGARVTNQGEWPRAIAAGAIGRRDLEPASDVNLLVTDGQMTDAPTGYGVRHVASVGGARHIARLPPFDELFASVPAADRRRKIVPNTPPTRTMQVLVHEIGHALGLHHDHGVAYRYGDAIVATPMLSSYAWSPPFDADESSCGTTYPDPEGLDRKLSLVFSACTRRELENYSGSFTG